MFLPSVLVFLHYTSFGRLVAELPPLQLLLLFGSLHAFSATVFLPISSIFGVAVGAHWLGIKT